MVNESVRVAVIQAASIIMDCDATLEITELDMKQIAYSQFDFDPVGHYSRPDVFKLIVNNEKQESIEWRK